MFYVIGAGGLAKDVMHICCALNIEHEIKAFLEENCARVGAMLLEKPIRDISVLNGLDRGSVKLICAIGTPLRKRLIEKTIDLGFEYESIIHPNVARTRWIAIGRGVVICPGAVLAPDVAIGQFAVINPGCTVGHDAFIGEYTTLSPGSNISGHVKIGSGCFIGTNAAIIEKVAIGDNTCIGAGAVVTNDIPANVLAAGIPAKPVRTLTEDDWTRLV